MKLVVRDDDTCGFTRVDELEKCYSGICNDVPVSLSVTPFRIPGNDRNLPPALAGNMGVFPLHENTELVDYLRTGVQQGQIDIAMHGYHHLRHNGLPEYFGGSDLEQKTAEGRVYLEELTGTRVLTFVPPNNSISLDALPSVVGAGMNIIHIPSILGRALRKKRIPAVHYLMGYLWHRTVRRHQYPYILDFGDHREVAYHTAGPRSHRKNLFEELRYCHGQDGVFVLATHYHAFDRQTMDGEPVRKLLFDLLDAAGGMPGVSFVGVNSIW